MLSALLLLALSAPPRTIEVDCRDGWPTRCTAGLYAKEQAPFDGVLLTGDLAAHLFLVEKNMQERIDKAVEKETKVKDVEVQHQKDLRAIDQKAFADKLDETNKAHARELDRVRMKWYEHPVFVMPASILGTIGIVLATKEIIEATK